MSTAKPKPQAANRRQTLPAESQLEAEMQAPSSQRSEAGDEIKDVKKQIQANYEATIGRCNKIKTDVDDAEESMRANVQKVASDCEKKDAKFMRELQAQLSTIFTTPPPPAQQRTQRGPKSVAQSADVAAQLKKNSDTLLQQCAYLEKQYLDASELVINVQKDVAIGADSEKDLEVLVDMLKLGARVVQKEIAAITRVQDGTTTQGMETTRTVEEEHAVKALGMDSVLAKQISISMQTTLGAGQAGIRKLTRGIPVDYDVDMLD